MRYIPPKYENILVIGNFNVCPHDESMEILKTFLKISNHFITNIFLF